jgi:hypothetical protein
VVILLCVCYEAIAYAVCRSVVSEYADKKGQLAIVLGGSIAGLVYDAQGSSKCLLQLSGM